MVLSLVPHLAAENVVRGHADLAAVHELAPAEPLDGVLQVARVVDVGGGLAAQLQRAGRQVPVGRLPALAVRIFALQLQTSFYPIIFPTAVLPV